MDARNAVTTALAKMAALRQADVSGKTLALYTAEIDAAKVPASIVVEACRRLQARQRHEGETAFPSLGTLLDECRIVSNWRAQEATDRERKRLPPAPISDEKWAEIRAQFERILGKKTFQ